MWERLGHAVAMVWLVLVVGCSGGASSSDDAAAPVLVTIGGSVSGLTGSGLVLVNNGGDALAVTANGTFTFATTLASGAMYDVTVATQPISPSQTCTVSHGAGMVSDTAITTIDIACITNAFSVAVAVSGLAGAGMVVANGDELLSIPANGTYAFATPIASGSSYAVSVAAQPTSPWQTCVVSNGTGAVSDSGVTVSIACSTDAETIGGSVSGLAPGAVLTLRDQAGALITLTGGTGPLPFTFPTQVPSGSAYDVTVSAQPTSPAQTCVVAAGTGTVGGSPVTTVDVTCTTNVYAVSAVVVGLAGGTLQLANNGTDALSVSSSGTHEFAAKVESGAAYVVTVTAQPAGQSCNVSSGSGVVGDADILVVVNCSLDYTVGGTVSGLSGSGLVLTLNGSEALAVASSGTFTFTTPISDGTSYLVAVASNPATPWQTCTVANDTGVITGANVTSVVVACVTNTFTIGGTVTGLSSGTLVLRNNGGDALTITSTTLGAGGTFAFPTPVASGQVYNVTVFQQPIAPGNGQTCVVQAGTDTGTVTSSNVTTVRVSCVNNYTVGGTVTGLHGAGLVIRLNGVVANSVTLGSPASTFTFPLPLAEGALYAVTVVTQPSGYVQTCTVASNGSGMVGSGGVSNVGITCGPVTRIEITRSAFTVNSVLVTSPAAIPDGVSNNCGTDNPGAALVGQISIPVHHFAVQKVTVRLNGLSHSWLGDLSATVDHAPLPFGSGVTAAVPLFIRVGRKPSDVSYPVCGSSSAVSGPYTFDDTAVPSLWTSTSAGTYHPTGFEGAFRAFGDSPAMGFNAEMTGGTWRISITDNNQQDVGTISSWTLTLQP